jgi:SAM-dependent methyltransferase
VSARAERKSRPGLRGWRLRRRYRFVLRHARVSPGARVLDVGGAQGVFGRMLLEAGAAAVTVVEPKRRHFEDAVQICSDPRLRLVHDDIFSRLDLLADVDTVTALHCLHQLGPAVHALLDAVEDSAVRRVILQGSLSHEAWVEPKHEEELWGPVLGLPRGLVRVLEGRGFRTQMHPHRRYPVVVGVR